MKNERYPQESWQEKISGVAVMEENQGVSFRA
jgi:hypothetical protein